VVNVGTTAYPNHDILIILGSAPMVVVLPVALSVRYRARVHVSIQKLTPVTAELVGGSVVRERVASQVVVGVLMVLSTVTKTMYFSVLIHKQILNTVENAIRSVHKVNFALMVSVSRPVPKDNLSAMVFADTQLVI
jgi:hypothetical protein